MGAKTKTHFKNYAARERNLRIHISKWEAFIKSLLLKLSEPLQKRRQIDCKTTPTTPLSITRNTKRKEETTDVLCLWGHTCNGLIASCYPSSWRLNHHPCILGGQIFSAWAFGTLQVWTIPMCLLESIKGQTWWLTMWSQDSRSREETHWKFKASLRHNRE